MLLREAMLFLLYRLFLLREAAATIPITRLIYFNENEHQLNWIWTSDICYSAKSLHDAMLSRGKTLCQFRGT